MPDEYKPCPFCGSNNISDSGMQTNIRGRTIGCVKCGARVSGLDLQSARDKWNHRAEIKVENFNDQVCANVGCNNKEQMWSQRALLWQNKNYPLRT